MGLAILASVAAGAVAYTLVSRWFLRNPGVLWANEIRTRPRIKEVESWHKPFVFSHRGGREEEVENSYEAFQHSVKNVPQVMLETDVYLTRDNKVVLFHDDDMSRMCGTPKTATIRDFDYADLPPLIPTETVKAANPATATRVTRIPLLEDLFKAFPDHVIYVECKPPVPELVPAVHELIVKYNRRDRTVWGSLGYTWMSDLCYKTDPGIPLYTASRNVLKYWAAYLFGLLPFVPIREKTLLVFDTHNIQNLALRLLFNMMRPDFVGHLKARGVITQAIGAGAATNDPDGWERSAAAGCDGICTDKPAAMWSYFAEKKGK